VIRDNLRRLRARVRDAIAPPQTWAPEPTIGAGLTELPDGTRLERCALVTLDELLHATKRPGRLTLVHHWATWAPAVADDVPHLLELHLSWAQYVDFIGVGWELMSGGDDVREAGLAVDDFHRSFGLTWRTLLYRGNRGKMREAVGLHSEILPQTIVRNGQGELVYRNEGALDDLAYRQLDDVFKELTGSPDDRRPLTG
jgi:hypothetical protein